jgi:uncharacterized membrane protein YjjP (DUF1212 family)
VITGVVPTLRFGTALALRHSWILAAPALFVVTALWLGLIYGAWGTFPLALVMLLHASVGMLGSYVVHECGHFAALRRCRGIRAVSVEAHMFRLSLRPHGEITARQAFGVALAGPLACLVPGAMLWAAVPHLGLAWWYVAHLVLLAPCFGDGKAVVLAIRRLRADQ